MVDATLRELERRWKESGAIEDEASYLQEQMRAGTLSQERLELAAYLGHEWAGSVTGVDPIPPKTQIPSSYLRRWAWGLERWGRRVHLRVAIAAIPLHPAPRKGSLWKDLCELLELADQNVAGIAMARDARHVHSRLYDLCEYDGITALQLPSDFSQLVAYPYLESICYEDESEAERLESEEDKEIVAAHTATYLACTLETLNKSVAQATILRGVRDELVPWLLGYGDPVAERVKAREASTEARAPNRTVSKRVGDRGAAGQSPPTSL